MRWLLGIALLSSGCSLILGSDAETATFDAAPEADAARVDAPIDAFAGNTTDFNQRYDCDAETLALYHFDGSNVANACAAALSLSASAPEADTNPPLGGAGRINGQASVYKSADGPDVVFENELTIEAWVRPRIQDPPDATALYIVTSNGAVSQNGQRRFNLLLVGQAGQFVLRAEIADEDCGNLFNNAEGGGIDDTNWHHVAVAVSSDPVDGLVTMDFFIDGVHQTRERPGTATGICGMDDDPTHIMVGGKAPLNSPDPIIGDFNHSVDEVRLSTVLRFAPPN